MDPIEFRRRNVVRPGDPMIVDRHREGDVDYGSYGLDQCLDLVKDAMDRGGGRSAAVAADWLVGKGVALGMIDTVPPGGHFADRAPRCARTAATSSPSARPNSATARTPCIARSRRTALGATMDGIHVRQSDTDHGGHDTGAFGSTGTVVAGLRDAARRASLA